MKRLVLLSSIVLFVLTQSAWGFGKRGHDAVAYIAECNLTKKAKKNIYRYLDHSIVYYASWMDNYRTTPEYKHTTYWHTGPVDADYYYTDDVRRPKGDVVSELENAINKLKSYKSLDDSTIIVNLKYVIHMVGDMHCPSHVGYPGLKRNYDIQINGKKYDYHGVWDTQVIEISHAWNYMEWQHQLDRCSKAEKSRIEAGSPRDWFHESAVDCRVIYDWAPEGSSQGHDFLNKAHPLVESQILKAGYRLAKVLNDLFN